MVQNSLIDYISSQTKLGVSRDAIKAALTGAGWPVVDVEDTLKQTEASRPAQSVQPATAATTAPAQRSSMAGKPASAASQGPASPSIRVSDLVSAPTSTSSFFSKAAATAPGTKAGSGKLLDPAPAQMRGVAGSGSQSDHHIVMLIVGVVLVVGFAGLAGYLYFQNNNLATKVASLNGASAGVASNLSSLQTQMRALTASNTALAAQNASLAADSAELALNLSFLAAPGGSLLTSSNASGSTASVISVKGVLSAGPKASYILTTKYGVQVYIKNSADMKVAKALKPLLASTSTVELAGTHAPGSPNFTVTAVNGVPL